MAHKLRSLLQEVQTRYGWELYAYVLMGNHVHLLVEVGGVPLSKVMQNLQFRYTRYYNGRYRKMGRMFQREKSREVSQARWMVGKLAAEQAGYRLRRRT